MRYNVKINKKYLFYKFQRNIINDNLSQAFALIVYVLNN